MDRRGFLTGCGCFGLLAGGPVVAWAEEAWVPPPRFQRPEPGSDEGGLWALLDREEAKLRRSRMVERDPALNAYVNRIACRLTAEHCPDIRVYVVHNPLFNASMAPNGMMQVWTGLLLRAANEAQLAAILGHEIGHYLRRHTVEQLRDAKSRTAFGHFLGMALGVAGAGAANPVAQLVLAAGMFSYSRQHEEEADRIGIELMARAGYAPIEASRVWEQLLAELKAEKDWSGNAGTSSVLFATHPLPADRQKDLASRARSLVVADTETGELPLREVLAPHRRQLLEDEVKRRKSGESIALLTRLLEETPDDPELRFFLGEVYRLRAAEGDLDRALGIYAAADRPGAPAELYRSIGVVHRQKGEREAAAAAFRRYLAAKPDAADAEMIRTYVGGSE